LKQNLINTTNSNNRNDSFNQDLCNAFVAANIPWNKLNSAPLKNFLTKYCNRNIPNESTLRKNYMLPCYNETISNIRKSIGESDICIIVDETTDITGRYMANIVVSKLTSYEAGHPYLLASKSLEKNKPFNRHSVY
jgi:hypothetical protein